MGGVQAGDQGRRVIASGFGDVSGLKHLTVGAVGFDQVADGLQLHRINNGTNVDTFVQRVANTKCLHACAQLFIESLGDALLHDQA